MTKKPLSIKLDEDLKMKLKLSGKRNGRTLHGHIVNVLRLSELSTSRDLLEALNHAQLALSLAINATPSGELRNRLTDANLLALEAINKSTKN